MRGGGLCSSLGLRFLLINELSAKCLKSLPLRVRWVDRTAPTPRVPWARARTRTRACACSLHLCACTHTVTYTHTHTFLCTRSAHTHTYSCTHILLHVYAHTHARTLVLTPAHTFPHARCIRAHRSESIFQASSIFHTSSPNFQKAVTDQSGNRNKNHLEDFYVLLMVLLSLV